ncbi:MAG: ribonuclease III [Lachnospiraceae bacterium]|nr:ribonuclease III [Lachnospiraceae bacterium]
MEKGIDIYGIISENMELADNPIESYSPLTLAYIGDAIYEIVVRTMVVSEGNTQVNKLHKRSSSLVKAETQARMIKLLMDADKLTEEELSYYKRGRNAKSYTSAKNASIGDYRIATGFEALMGYLYITGQSSRMISIIKDGLKLLENSGIV